MRYSNDSLKTRVHKLKSKLAFALREKLREGYTQADFRSDLMAGLVVGMVAIPLGMALAIASGVAPQYGLYTVIVAGFLVAVLGGSRFNVTGPTAAFVVILAPIAEKYGLGGLLTAGMMAGAVLLLLGVSGLGQAIKLIPHPVTTGFTSGIAVVIATIQVKDFFGLELTSTSEHYFERVEALVRAFPTWSPIETSVALSTLALLLTWPKFNTRIPAPLIALGVVTLAVIALQKIFPSLDIATIGSRFSATIDGEVVRGIPHSLPSIGLPWTFSESGRQVLNADFKIFEALIPSAIAIALLGAIESLLCAVVADGMTQKKHDPDAELMALGVANIVAPFFGGIAATGAIARTATSIRFGARSPIAAIVHASFALLAVVLFAPYVSYLPMAALAALLVLVAYNMSEVKNFRHILQVAPKSDVLVLFACFSLTVLFDMVIGVIFGVMLAALLFMRRMASFSHGEVIEGPYHRFPEVIPPQVVLYEIAGPMFFGAAEKAVSNLGSITDKIKVIIFDLEDVPVMDVTGLVAFETAITYVLKHNRHVFLVGLKRQPQALLTKAHVIDKHERVRTMPSVREAVNEAKKILNPTPP